MKTYRLALKVRSAFGTPLVGDTFFGQLCWTLSSLLGEKRLDALLEGYRENRPFAVVSDAFPWGYLPLPVLPGSFWNTPGDVDRKRLKKMVWVPLESLDAPLENWQSQAKSEMDITVSLGGQGEIGLKKTTMHQHNTINRATGTTGTGMFAPYVQPEFWYLPDMPLDLYVVLDESRLDAGTLREAVEMMGTTGYGRDASIGLGRFTVNDMSVHVPKATSGTRVMTLAPCAPQGLGLDASRSYYRVTTRFGRHGNSAARGTNPFKRPVLLAATGAVLARRSTHTEPFIGQGIGGVSYMDAKTVHQGYAPVYFLPEAGERHE